MEDPTDEELNAYIMAHLKMLGVDLTVLPEDDKAAPADRTRILSSARRFLRSSPPVIARFPLDPQLTPPEMYPADILASFGRRSRER